MALIRTNTFLRRIRVTLLLLFALFIAMMLWTSTYPYLRKATTSNSSKTLEEHKIQCECRNGNKHLIDGVEGEPMKSVNTSRVHFSEGGPITSVNTIRVPIAKSGPIKSLTSSPQITRTPTGNWTSYRFPLDIDMVDLVQKIRRNQPVAEKPIFIYNYNMTYHPVDKCSTGSPRILFLIKSAVGFGERRITIRQTWASNSVLERFNIIRMFLVGHSDKLSVMSAVDAEHKIYKDVIRLSFKDNYYNNTLKTIGAIHWTAEHCSRPKYVVFVDDDVFVATSRLSDFIESKVNETSQFFGGFVCKHIPYRRKIDRWYVSWEDYPYDLYPRMPSAGFMIMTMTYVIDVHIASQYTKKFIYDDAYLAIIAYKLHVYPVHIKTVIMDGTVTERQHAFKTFIAAHGYSPNQMKRTWLALEKATHPPNGGSHKGT